MLRIRLTRVGKKRQPYYRIVVADKEAKRDGRIVERIGHYDPLTNPATFSIEEDRALYWLSVGAQPSDAVRRLLDKQGTTARLARLNAGEPIDTLVAEFEGVALEDKGLDDKAIEEAVMEVEEAVLVAEAVAVLEEEE